MVLFLFSFIQQLQSYMTSLAVLVAASELAKVMDASTYERRSGVRHHRRSLGVIVGAITIGILSLNTDANSRCLVIFVFLCYPVEYTLEYRPILWRDLNVPGFGFCLKRGTNPILRLSLRRHPCRRQ